MQQLLISLKEQLINIGVTNYGNQMLIISLYNS